MERQGSEKGKVTYRSRVTLIAAVWVALVFVGCIGIGISAFVGGGAYEKAHRPLEDVLGVVIVSLGSAGAIWSLWRLGRMGVETSDQGVLIRNRFRTFRLQWQDIDGFKFGDELEDRSFRESLLTPSLQTYAVLRSGKRILLAGLTSTRVRPSRSRQRVQDSLDVLNAQVVRHSK